MNKSTLFTGCCHICINVILVECLCWMVAILELSENRPFAMVEFMGIFNCGETFTGMLSNLHYYFVARLPDYELG